MNNHNQWIGQKPGKFFTVCFGPALQSIERGRLSREEALDVRESRERRDKFAPIFSPGKQERRNFGLIFSALFCAGSLVVRKSRHRRDRLSDKDSRKRRKEMGSDIFFKSGRAHPNFNAGNFHFLAAEKLTSGGGGVQLKNLLASDYPGAYTSMPHPSFGAKYVLFVKTVAK